MILLSTQSVLANSSESSSCAYREAKKLRSIYLNKKYRDKSLHCIISCRMAHKCGKVGSWSIGIVKEIADLLGMGNPEMADIKANNYGIKLSGQISNAYQCDDYCLIKFEN